MNVLPVEEDLLRRAVDEARAARTAGNHPFGAVLADADGRVLLTAQNTVVTESDVTGHAETNLVRLAGRRYDGAELGRCTLYSSAEPCAMCAGAIYWSGVGRVVYALAEQALLALTADDPQNPTMSMPCRTVFAAGQREIEVVGPVELAGAREVHDGFWTAELEAYVKTPRMVLRRFTTDDVDLLTELDSDPEVMFWITGGRTTPREEISSELLPHILAWYERSAGFGFWAAIDKATGEFLGWFHFRPGDGAGPDSPELGYRLRRSVWGRGLATEGSIALIDKGFRELGIERVYAETMAVNVASRRVMEKAGLRHVRSYHADWPYKIPGDENGDVEYAITREQWQADATARA